MYKVLLFLLMSQFITAQTDLLTIEINPQNKSQGKLMFSDLVESIEYIPLETKGKCLVSTITSFDVSEKYILVSCNQTQNLLLFNRKGEFLNTIGQQGQGPGEYFRPGGFLLDEENKQVILLNSYPKQVLYYNLKGKHLKTINEKGGGRYLRIFNDCFFVATANYNGQIPYVYEIRNRDFQLISEHVKTIPFKMSSFLTYPGIPRDYIFNDKIYIKEVTLNDTIYSVDKNFVFTPAYRVHFGKYEITTDVRGESDPDRYFKRITEFAQFDRIVENKNYLLFSYYYNNGPHYGYYDKTSRKILHFPSNHGIPNDYDGGPDYWPQRQDNRTLYRFYDAHLFDSDELMNKKRTVLKGSEKEIKSFQKLQTSIDPEDNPVLVIVKLKE